jgi:hypothetical protein
MATTDNVEAAASDHTPKPPKQRRTGLIIALALVGLLAVGGVAYLLSPSDVTIVVAPAGPQTVSPSVTAAPTTTLATAPVAATVPDGTTYDASPCPVAPVPTSITDSQTIVSQLFLMRKTGFVNRTKDCFEHVWSTEDNVNHDLAFAKFDCNVLPQLSNFTGSASAYTGAVVTYSAQTCQGTVSYTAKLEQVGNEWRLAYVKAS